MDSTDSEIELSEPTSKHKLSSRKLRVTSSEEGPSRIFILVND